MPQGWVELPSDVNAEIYIYIYLCHSIQCSKFPQWNALEAISDQQRGVNREQASQRCACHCNIIACIITYICMCVYTGYTYDGNE